MTLSGFAYIGVENVLLPTTVPLNNLESILNTIIPVIRGVVRHIDMKYRKWKSVIPAKAGIQ
jgi:hypothetical protein